jgi:beta-phosphoglucomutase-like phosphatase (HAD superfamily)
LASSFEVFAGDVVHEKKPAPAIYELTLEQLRLDRSDAVVIEDSRNGLLAATGAKLKCVVTVNGYTVHESFEEAALVVTDLGDPGGRPMRVLANRSSAEPAVYVTLADLQAVLYGV